MESDESSEDGVVHQVRNHKHLVSQLDYLVSSGDVFEVVRNDFSGELGLRERDAIPDSYWKRREDDHDDE